MLILSNRPSLYIFDPLNGFELFHQTVEGGDVIDRDGDMSLKKAVVRVDRDASHIYVFFFWNNRCNVRYDTDIVVSDNSQDGDVFRTHFSRPAGIDYSVTVTTVYVSRVRTIFTVYLDSSFCGDKSKDFVAVNGVAAFGQFIVDTFDIAAYDELVFFRFVGFFL